MNTLLSLLICGWLVLALPGCGGGSGSPAANNHAVIDGSSGVKGMAVEGPLTPVQQPGVPSTKPLAGAIITIQPDGGGTEIARTTADGQGSFQIALAPGTYRLVPLPPQPGIPFPIGSPQTITVTTGVFLIVTVNYDTGIR